MPRIVVVAFLVASFFVTTVVPSLADPYQPQPAAFDPGTAAFQRTWERTDKPVADGMVDRTWMWGPEILTDVLTEAYGEAAGGQRTVQYFDKSRMEINDPNAVDDGLWYVTNGLLVKELITGDLQTGEGTYEGRSPASINVAGDSDDPTGPTYATLEPLLDAAPATSNAVLTQRLDRDGNVTNDPSLASMNATAAHRVQVTDIDHQVASPFWEFMTSVGSVYENGQFTTAALFVDPFYATGYPITEAYWANVKVGGEYQDVLLQCFERRCLTYTPGNKSGWKVEAGNVGQHYYEWRYGIAGSSEPYTPLPEEIATDPATGEDYITGVLVVMLELDTPESRIIEIANQIDGEIIGGIDILRFYELRVPATSIADLNDLAANVSSLRDVTAASPDWLHDPSPTSIPNDPAWNEDNPDYSQQTWHLRWINAPFAWDIATGKDEDGYSTPVGIIDYGFDIQHDDLKGNVTRWTATEGQKDPGLQFPKHWGHGSHVAGIACAQGNNGTGITGVAWDCDLRVYNPGIAAGTDKTRITDAYYQQMMMFAASEGARVVNISIGATYKADGTIVKDCRQAVSSGDISEKQRDQEQYWGRGIEYAIAHSYDALWVFAAGNSCSNAKYTPASTLTQRFPENVMLVANMDEDGSLYDGSLAAEFPYIWLEGGSNYGPDVTVAAPGDHIFSTLPENTYDYLSGTSMAAPVVTGIAALVFSANPDLSASQVKECIVAGAVASEYTVSGPDGHEIPVVDAEEALLQCEPVVVPEIPTAPSNLVAAGVSPSQIKLTWQDTSDNESGFRIYGSAGTLIGSVGEDIQSYEVTGLDPDSEHCYQVAAFNSAGDESPKSNVACARTTTGAGLAAPSGLWGYYHETWGPYSVTLNWQDNSNNEAGFEIYGSYYVGSQPDVFVARVVGGIETYSYPANDDIQCYAVRAYNGSGYSGWSNVACLGESGGSPAAPSNLVGYAPDGDSIVLDWQDNSGDETGFEIYYNAPTDGFTFLAGSVGPDITHFEINGLTPNATYGLSVVARNGFGYSNWSNEVIVTTLSGTETECSVVPEGSYCVEYFSNSNLSGSPVFSQNEQRYFIQQDWIAGSPGNGVGNDSFSVRWTGMMYFDEDGDRTFIGTGDDGFRVWIDGSLIIDAWVNPSPEDTVWFTENINITTGYHLVVVEHYDLAGNANIDVTWDCTYVDCIGIGETPPEPPAVLVATRTSPTTVYLEWHDNSDNEDGFEVFHAFGTSITIVGPNVTNYTVTGLDPDTRYCFDVFAFNEAGYSWYGAVHDCADPLGADLSE